MKITKEFLEDKIPNNFEESFKYFEEQFGEETDFENIYNKIMTSNAKEFSRGGIVLCIQMISYLLNSKNNMLLALYAIENRKFLNTYESEETSLIFEECKKAIVTFLNNKSQGSEAKDILIAKKDGLLDILTFGIAFRENNWISSWGAWVRVMFDTIAHYLYNLYNFNKNELYNDTKFEFVCKIKLILFYGKQLLTQQEKEVK